MPFKVTARTILQLGGELISSDAVAFYELIKNAFDAGSPKVNIRVISRLPYQAIETARDTIRKGNESKQRSWSADECANEMKTAIAARVLPGASTSPELKKVLLATNGWAELSKVLDEANFIEINDTGSGMSRKDLTDIYLTIGTRSRLKQRNEQRGAGAKPILGEKGLGRLSAMRLGWKLHVQTTKEKERFWNILNIDWRQFSHDSDQLIEDIEIQPEAGGRKDDPAEKGTRLRISALTGAWDEAKLTTIAASEFSKLTDPFVPKARYPIGVTFNGSTVAIPTFDRLLMKYASAVGNADFVIEDDVPRLTGEIDYRMRQRTKSFTVEGEHLLSAVKQEDYSHLINLGPFAVEFSWFNRKAIRELEGDIEEIKRVLKLQQQWAGGLMVFRDGFRVHPYGNPDDDWLDLDKKALASGGYKVNRRQIVGKVVITSNDNPELLDQSNREGLRDCEEKRVLISLLKHTLETIFRTFLNKVEEQLRVTDPITFEDLEELLEHSEEKLASSMHRLAERYPAAAKDHAIMSGLRSAIADIQCRVNDAKTLAESLDSKYAQVIHLAGTGLMIEMLAHELTRAATNALAALSDAGREDMSPRVSSLVATLQSELTTLQRRLRVLDPLSTSGRQRKSVFSLVEWVTEILDAHVAQFERHGIDVTIRTVPKNAQYRVKAVKGMVVQVLENLISNSVYWLTQRRKLNRSFTPEISVVLDARRGELQFTDNGPGVCSTSQEEIFQPFVTTKPPGEGKGLGLYIAREVARYNDANLCLSDEVTEQPGRLNTFVLSLRSEE